MKLKLRKIGTSLGVIIPRKVIEHYNAGDLIEVNIIINSDNTVPKEEPIIIKNEETYKPRWWCHPHKKWNTECGCQGGV